MARARQFTTSAGLAAQDQLSEILAIGNTTGGTDIVVTNGDTVVPASNDGAALGVSGTAWADLFLASGAIIDFAASNMQINHAAGYLQVTGGNLGINTAPSHKLDITVDDTDNVNAILVTQNDTTNNPIAVSIAQNSNAEGLNITATGDTASGVVASYVSDSLTTGNGIEWNSNNNAATTANLWHNLIHQPSGITADFTGSGTTMTFDRTLTAAATRNDGGNVLSITMQPTVNNAGATLNSNTKNISLSYNGTQTAGTLDWTGALLTMDIQGDGINSTAKGLELSSDDGPDDVLHVRSNSSTSNGWTGGALGAFRLEQSNITADVTGSALIARFDRTLASAATRADNGTVLYVSSNPTVNDAGATINDTSNIIGVNYNATETAGSINFSGKGIDISLGSTGIAAGANTINTSATFPAGGTAIAMVEHTATLSSGTHTTTANALAANQVWSGTASSTGTNEAQTAPVGTLAATAWQSSGTAVDMNALGGFFSASGTHGTVTQANGFFGGVAAGGGAGSGTITSASGVVGVFFGTNPNATVTNVAGVVSQLNNPGSATITNAIGMQVQAFGIGGTTNIGVDIGAITGTGAVALRTTAGLVYMQETANQVMHRWENTHADDGGVQLELYANSASPAADDVVGMISFQGEDDAGNKTEYGVIGVNINSAANGSELSGFFFDATDGGVTTPLGDWSHDGSNASLSVGDEAATGIIQSSGNFDLQLQTGNATTGTIVITDGANGDITLTPNGTGLVDASSSSIRIKRSTADVSSPPTDAELDAAFGDPTTVGDGFVGIVDDNDAGTASWIVWTTGTAGEWFYAAGTKAV